MPDISGKGFAQISKSKKTAKNWHFAEAELKERAAALPRMVAYAMAKEAFDTLLKEIPTGASYAELRKSLKLVEVGGGKHGHSAAFAIHVDTRSRRIRKMDAATTLITIQAKRGLKRAQPDVAILEKYGPWTIDTIPFWPTKRDAIIIQRKISERQITSIAKQLKLTLPKIFSELREAGRRIRPLKPGSPGRLGRNAKAVPDLAMQVLSLEFGGGGTKSKPVFRKAIGSVKRGRQSIAKRFSKIADAMTKPGSNAHKTWPKKIAKISSSKASSFRGFQKRLGFG